MTKNLHTIQLGLTTLDTLRMNLITADQVEFFYCKFMSKTYSKTPLNVKEQIELLESRGLHIEDKEECAEFLENISYYRLGWYIKEFYNEDNAFIKNTTFRKIKNVYITDQKLRQLIAGSIDCIEVALRTKLVNVICCHFQTPFWHTDNNNIQEIVKNKVKISKGNNCPFKHFNKKYSEKENTNHNYPFWLISEFLFFSEISIIYGKYLKDEKYKVVRKNISKNFDLNPYQLERCLHSLSILRNVVAHHDKIYKRIFPFPARNKNFKFINNEEEPFVKYNFFINHYYIIDHLLSKIQPKNTWRQDVNNLLKDKEIAYKYGFTNKSIEYP